MAGTPLEPIGEAAALLCAMNASGKNQKRAAALVTGFHSRGVLPHLKQEGGTYFVTFRQQGSLPKEILLTLKRERERIIETALAAKRPLTWAEQKDLFRWYSERVDKYLDSGSGECHLKQPELADLVANAMRFFQGARYDLHAWVVMPNHVHAVLRPVPPHTLSQILHSWKSYTAHKMKAAFFGEVSRFWQSESYDHLIRDQDDMMHCCRYTIQNPVQAKLCATPEDWKWSSAYRTA